MTMMERCCLKSREKIPMSYASKLNVMLKDEFMK